jgi:hypothetical protein
VDLTFAAARLGARPVPVRSAAAVRGLSGCKHACLLP